VNESPSASQFGTKARRQAQTPPHAAVASLEAAWTRVLLELHGAAWSWGYPPEDQS
jgi:hypothetical protein